LNQNERKYKKPEGFLNYAMPKNTILDKKTLKNLQHPLILQPLFNGPVKLLGAEAIFTKFQKTSKFGFI